MATTGVRGKAPFRTPRTQAVGGGSGPNPNRSQGADSAKLSDPEGSLDPVMGVPKDAPGAGQRYKDERETESSDSTRSINAKNPVG